MRVPTRIRHWFVVAFVISSLAAGTLALTRERQADDSRPAQSVAPLKDHLHHPPGSIVGSETPELIPPEVAAGQFLALVAGMSDKGDHVLNSYFKWIERSGGISLSPSERSAIKTAALDHRSAMKAAVENRTDVSNVRNARTQSVQLQWSRLGKSLTPKSAAAIQRYVDVQVRHNTKILRRTGGVS